MHTAGGCRGGDLTVFSHTLVSADLSCSYLHQTSGEESRREAEDRAGGGAKWNLRCSNMDVSGILMGFE